MGTGSFLLSEYCPDLKTLFKRGVYLDWFDNTDNMMDKIRYYLENEEKRQLIATQGCQLVHEKYSWDKIIQNVLDIVQKERTKGVMRPF